MVRLLIELRLFTETAFHTTGNVRRFGVDKALARDVHGRPVIPATTIKGFLREKAEILLRSWGQPVCLGPEPGGMCKDHPFCRICRAFGNPRFPSPLRFGDGHPADELSDRTDVRSGVAISRHRRGAFPQRLFFIETMPSHPVEWVAAITGHFQDADQAREAAALVALAATWGAAIGGAKSRGLGWLKAIHVRATIDGQEVPLEELHAIWRQWKGEPRVGHDPA